MAPLNKNLKNKGKIPKMTTQTLLDFDLGESSSDSDFRIEDHDDDDDSDDFSGNSKDSDDGNLDDDDENDSLSDNSGDIIVEKGKSNDKLSNFSPSGGSNVTAKTIEKVNDIVSKTVAGENTLSNFKLDLSKNLICCACLGDRSDDSNEIVECDGCGVTVHEGCYGISDTISISSTNSSCSTEPWFCEACKASVTDPSCELCPGRGGIFKETEVGRWVHLICALYVPGVAFGEVDHLSSVTLFEMQYSKWGAKQCTLCEDDRYARTGVCIGCDAGMCKTFFHVTCAQAAGFLSEPHSDEADHADPFYAHCKVHSDKTMIKHRKRNYNLLKIRMMQIKALKEDKSNQKQTTEQQRIQRKLTKHQNKYKIHKETKNEPWVPTQKIPRLLTTSATAVRRLHAKATAMGVDTELLEFQEAQIASISDVRKKWHIPPAFSVEFVAYYLDRINRMKELKTSLGKNIEDNKRLLTEQTQFREEYDAKIKANAEFLETNAKLKSIIEEMHKQINQLCPNKQLHSIDFINRSGHQHQIISHVPHIRTTAVASSSTCIPSNISIPRTMSVPTAAARKMGVGFPLNNLPGEKKGDTSRVLSTQIHNKNELVHNCGICKGCHDQHLLAKCDTCHLHYHLGCLNPPLTRHPKKSKLYGWQCSECDKSDDSDVIVDLPPGPRRSRTKFSKDGKIVPVDGNDTLNSFDEENSIIMNNITDKSPVKRKSTDRRSSISQPLSPKTSSSVSSISTKATKKLLNSTEIISEHKTTMYNGQIRSPKEASPPKSPKKHATTRTSGSSGANVRKITSPNKFLNSTSLEGDISQDKNSNSILTNKTRSNSEEISDEAKRTKRHHLIISKSPPPTKTTTLLSSSPSPIKIRPSSSGAIPIKAIFDPLAIDKESPLAENVIKPVRTPKGKKETNEDVDPLQISPNKLNCNVNITMNNEHDVTDILLDEMITEDDEAQIKFESLDDDDSIENLNAKIRLLNKATTSDKACDLPNKQIRKKRKEKHKNRNHSDSDKSPSKEHKRKRKKKSHDMENPKNLSTITGTSSSSVPKIKIKFKTLPLPGEQAPEPQFFYVSADMVRPTDASRPSSVETVEEMATTINNDNDGKVISEIDGPRSSTPVGTANISGSSGGDNSPRKRTPKPINRDTPKSLAIPPKQTASSPKRAKKSRMSTNSNFSISNTSTGSQLLSSTCSINCITCNLIGTIQNSVQCDECFKVYHFSCLDPPVKKTPKRRGYSWHCADCDPTDHEGVS